MSRTQKLWFLAAFIAVDTVLAVGLVIYLLRDPYRAADAPRAQVGEAQPTTHDAADRALPVETVPFESADLLFTGSSALGEQPGFFENVRGEALLADDGTVRGLRGTVQMASVMTNADSLTAKLRSEPGFFEVDKYPTAEFTSTSIEPAIGEAAAKGATHQIVGNLTLRGITRSIGFPAKIEVTPERFSLEGEFSVNRQDFGVSYEGGAAFPDIRDLVLINLNISAPRKSSGDASDSPTRQANQDDPTTSPSP